MPLERPPDATFVILHWGAKNEKFDPAKVLNFYRLDYPKDSEGNPLPMDNRVPTALYRVHSDDPEAFLATLKEALVDNPDLYHLLIAAHGNSRGLIFSENATKVVSYCEIANTISAVTTVDAMQVIFGACRAMSVTPPIERLFGDNVTEVWGFELDPQPCDSVGLLANKMTNDVKLYDAYMRLELRTFKEDYTDNVDVRGDGGRLIRAYRDGDALWQRESVKYLP